MAGHTHTHIYIWKHTMHMYTVCFHAHSLFPVLTLNVQPLNCKRWSLLSTQLMVTLPATHAALPIAALRPGDTTLHPPLSLQRSTLPLPSNRSLPSLLERVTKVLHSLQWYTHLHPPGRLSSSAARQTTDLTQEDKEQLYKSLRAEATVHANLRAEAFQKAAHARSRKLWEVASFYAQQVTSDNLCLRSPSLSNHCAYIVQTQGHTHTDKMNAANRRAAEVIFKQT